MAQHDYDIANSTGLNVRNDINNVLDAIVSNNSGSTAPSTTFAYMWWADTTTNILKLRNSSNDGWISLRELDGTMVIEDGSAGTPGIAFADDLNTGLFSAAADTLNISAGGTERAEFSTSAIVFNDGGASYDFRVEGDTEPNLFMVDGSADAVGIGTATPGTLLELESTAPYITLRNNTEENADGGRESRIIFEGERGDGTLDELARIEVNQDGTGAAPDSDFIISTNNAGTLTEALRVTGTQQVGIGTTEPGTQLEVAGANAYLTLHNTSTEDTEGSRETRIIFDGTRSGTEVSTLAQIQASHDGTGDDDRGDLIFSVNNDTALTERLRIHSNGRSEVTSAFSGIQTLTDGATITADLATGNFFTVTLGGNRQLGNPNNKEPGQAGTIFVLQDGSGNRELTYDTDWEFAGGSPPTLTTTASAVDRIDYIVRSSTSIHAVATLNYS